MNPPGRSTNIFLFKHKTQAVSSSSISHKFNKLATQLTKGTEPDYSLSPTNQNMLLGLLQLQPFKQNHQHFPNFSPLQVLAVIMLNFSEPFWVHLSSKCQAKSSAFNNKLMNFSEPFWVHLSSKCQAKSPAFNNKLSHSNKVSAISIQRTRMHLAISHSCLPQFCSPSIYYILKCLVF